MWNIRTAHSILRWRGARCVIMVKTSMRNIGGLFSRWEVKVLGARSRRMRSLRRQWQSKFRGQRCLVLGSAPGAVIPAHCNATICINGSVWAAHMASLPKPALTVMARYGVTGTTDKARKTLDILRGLATDELLYVSHGQPEAEIRQILHDAAFGFSRLELISRRERAIVLREISGRDFGQGERDERVSNGMFAVSIAIWGGAKEVVLSGFSLEGGHSYIASPTPRHHAATDLEFLLNSKTFGAAHKCSLTTTSQEISRAADIPLSLPCSPSVPSAFG